MKIMFYINTISHGGAERVIVNIASQLSERGYDCLLATSFRCLDFEYSYSEKVERIVLSEKRIGNPIIRNIKYIKILRNRIKEFSPDVIVSFMPEANYRSLLASIGLRTKTIISVRSDPNWEYKSPSGRLLAKTLYKQTDGIVFQTQDAKHWFPQTIQDKGEIIFNQVGEQFYHESLNKDRHNIVAIGRLTMLKNYKMLIDAFARVCDNYDEKLLIYGEGALREELVDYIKSCHLEGKAVIMGPTSDVPNVLKSAKLYVLSSDAEGMPNALMEAMAIGLPCISTDCPCGGPKMLFGEELKYYLVTVGDSQAMSEKITELLSDGEKRDEVGSMCKKKAEEFRPQAIIQKWEKYINEVATK